MMCIMLARPTRLHAVHTLPQFLSSPALLVYVLCHFLIIFTACFAVAAKDAA